MVSFHLENKRKEFEGFEGFEGFVLKSGKNGKLESNSPCGVEEFVFSLKSFSMLLSIAENLLSWFP